MMPLPNLIIIGAAKCGTTALYWQLRRHPQIFMSPVKEPRYFAFCRDSLPNGTGHLKNIPANSVTDLEDYKQLFRCGPEKVARGEASPFYLSDFQPEVTAASIKKQVPDARLIALLRQPADRAYSAFLFLRQLGFEPLGDFQKALDAEPERVKAGYLHGHYRGNGFYYANLRPFFNLFPGKQIRVYLYEDWRESPADVLADIFRFLGVEEAAISEAGQRVNVTAPPRNFRIQRLLVKPNRLKKAIRAALPETWRRFLLTQAIRLNRAPRPQLDPRLRRRLSEGYRDDILRLQELLGRDLSHWLRD